MSWTACDALGKCRGLILGTEERQRPGLPRPAPTLQNVSGHEPVERKRAAHESRKWSQRQEGPLRIKRVVNNLAYELKLPPQIRIHHVVPVKHPKQPTPRPPYMTTAAMWRQRRMSNRNLTMRTRTTRSTESTTNEAKQNAIQDLMERMGSYLRYGRHEPHGLPKSQEHQIK